MTEEMFGHSGLRSGDFVEFAGERMDGGVIGGLATEGADDFHRGAEFVERVELDDLGVLEIQPAIVRVFVKEGCDDLAGEVAVFRKVIALFYLLRAFLAGERLLLVGDVADQVERIEGRACLLIPSP